MGYKDKEREKRTVEKYKQEHYEKIVAWQKEYGKQYRQDNKELIVARAKKFKQEHPERIKVYNKKWCISNSDKMKAKSDKQNHKRRQLGFFPLNKYFNGAEAHHISENFIIYIPKKLHRSTWHNIRTWRGMEQINILAINYI